MEELLIKLAHDSPWIAITGYLLWRMFSQQDRQLDAYKDGQTGNISLSAAIESLENSHGAAQTAILSMHADVRESRADMGQLRSELQAVREELRELRAAVRPGP